MTRLIDFYFSPSLFDLQMNSETWSDEHDAYMPVVKIDGKYVPFSEQITHGITPSIKRDDVIFLGTFTEEEADIQVVKRYGGIQNG